ncbi:hypothetical protein PP613_23610 [Mycobacteroides abscessus]|nr:hypothetical protein [Mycobacteroides abscessus]MDM2412331.1 hypothetical protein [Mycobacteroides abscessus]
MSTEENISSADADDAIPAASLPNPFGAGALKLTPPSRSRARQSDPEPVVEPETVANHGVDRIAAPDGASLDDGQAGGQEQRGGVESVEDEEDQKPNKSILKVFGAILGTVLLLSVTVWWYSRPEPEEPKPSARRAPLPTAAAPPAQVKVAADDGPIPFTLTSDCIGQTEPRLAASTEPRTAWTCPTNGVPFGQVLVATMAKPYVVTGIKYWAGFNGVEADGSPAWFHNRVLMLTQFVFNNPDKTLLESAPRGERHEIVVPVEHILASTVTMTVRESAPPPPAPVTTPTAAPSGGSPDEAPLPNLETLFPAPGENPDAANDPNGAKIAVWGFQLIGHEVQ